MASPLLAGLVVLMIGDSHFAYPGTLVNTLQDVLIGQGAKVTTYGACGASASVWALGGAASCGTALRVQSGPLQSNHTSAAIVQPVATLIAQIHPGLIIVGLGDTMADYSSPRFPAGETGDAVSLLTHRIQATNIPCIWVGPGWGTEGGPYFKTYARSQQMSEFLAAHVAPCRYVDSTRFSQPGEWPTFDGLHYTVAGYQKWALAIDAALIKIAPPAPG